MRRALVTNRSVSSYLKTTLRGILTSRRGQAGVITAILAPVIVAAAGLAIDAALWQVNQRSLQGAADQAAIAGINAYVVSGDTDNVATDAAALAGALAVAQGFGYSACTLASGSVCPCAAGKYGACAGSPTTVSPADTHCTVGSTTCLQVSITEPQQRYLSRVLYTGNPVAQAKATAVMGAGGSCVLALDQNPAGGGNPPTSPPSVSLGGSSQMNLSACNLVNNLNDPGATKNDTDVTGSSILSATAGGQILLAQTDTFFGTGQVTPTPVYGTSPAPDPYADRTPPSTAGGCTYPSAAFDSTQTLTSGVTLGTATTDPSGTSYGIVFTPASPTTPVVICGGLNITTGSVFFKPGIYIMDGGGLSATGNATIYGANVTIYVTCDSKFTGLTTNPATGHKISPTPDCTKNYGTISIAGTGGSCSGGGTCDPNGYCESSTKCTSSSTCSGSSKYCSMPDGTFYGDVFNTTTIANLVQLPPALAVGDAISGLGIPVGATVSAIGANSLTISAAATNAANSLGEALQGPGFCSKACTGGGGSPKVTLTPPVAAHNPPTGTAGISVWINGLPPPAGAPTGQAVTFTGDAGLNINGAIYAPTSAVTYEGGNSASASTQCNQLVALTVNMSGGHDTSFSQLGCTASSGVASSGKAELVE